MTHSPGYYAGHTVEQLMAEGKKNAYFPHGAGGLARVAMSFQARGREGYDDALRRATEAAARFGWPDPSTWPAGSDSGRTAVGSGP